MAVTAEGAPVRCWTFPGTTSDQLVIRKVKDDLGSWMLNRVERGWRDLKGALRLRPVFHHREDRIRSRIQLCWLALLLIRVIENGCGDTWRNVRNELDRMHLVTLGTKEGRIAKRPATTKGQREILTALNLREPAQILDYELPTPVE